MRVRFFTKSHYVELIPAITIWRGSSNGVTEYAVWISWGKRILVSITWNV